MQRVEVCYTFFNEMEITLITIFQILFFHFFHHQPVERKIDSSLSRELSLSL
jgi:hypothetical protein